MSDETNEQGAGGQSLGFDYQFYYFMYLALNLRIGQQLGYEMKDDVHIDKPDGTTVLLQLKHTIQKRSDGKAKNLTSLDIDLWKTLSIWAKFVKDNIDFTKNNSFILVTNKSEFNNDFIEKLNQFKETNDIGDLHSYIQQLKSSDDSKKNYIKIVNGIGKRRQIAFFKKLQIETECDDIIKRIKNRILERISDMKYVDAIYNLLYSNLQESKFLEIKKVNNFVLTFDKFNEKFGKCFSDILYKNAPLPKRNFPIILPENLDEQKFIKQLLDIGEIKKDSSDIAKYTTDMLKFINHFNYWIDDNFLLETEAYDFKENSINIWANKFKSVYRPIQKRIDLGTDLKDLEDDIVDLALELVDFIKAKNLHIARNNLGLDFSNGHYYALSDGLDIGWHFDWENKY